MDHVDLSNSPSCQQVQLQASATAQPEAECKNHCHTFFGTLHHAPSGVISRVPADTRYLGIASEFYLNSPSCQQVLLQH